MRRGQQRLLHQVDPYSRLVLPGVYRGAGQFALRERAQQSPLVEHATTSGIDHKGARFHGPQKFAPNQIVRRIFSVAGEWNMRRNKVAIGQLRERSETVRRRLASEGRIAQDRLDTDGASVALDARAARTDADNPDRLSVQLYSQFLAEEK